MRILVTRPSPLGEELCEILRNKGYDAIFFPVIEMAPPQDVELFKKNIASLNQFDWIVFNSPQAVLKSLPEIKSTIQKQKFSKIAAIGEGTAHFLRSANLTVDLVPDKWNSEGLLDTPEFKDVKNKKIAIICGENGRDILQKELIQRGANVTLIYAYRRILPDISPSKEAADIMVCTSNQGLTHLKKLINDTQTPVLVISDRMMEHAKKLGYKKIFVAKNASHRAILEALEELRAQV